MSDIVNSYVSIDLETTGLNPKTDKIIEIGAIKVDNGVVSDMFSALVNPGRKLDGRIIELTGIHDGDVEAALYIEEILPQLLEFVGEYPLLGHRILFDYSFIKKAAVDNKLIFEKNGIDTLKIARKYLDKLEHRNLDYLCEYYGISHHAHRALEDAKAAHLLYGKLVEQFFDETDSLFVPAPLVFKVKRDTPASKKQKERLYRMIELHKIIPDADIEHLTKSEADRFIDRLLAKYGR
jgi:DNA polymerase-3 subunit alpha (Gram-positive type)